VRFYCFTIPGLEDVSAGEIVSRLPGARVEEKKQGIVFFAYQEDLRPLLELSTAEDVFALVARGRASRRREGLAQVQALVRDSRPAEEAAAAHRRLRPKKVRRVTYRVVAQRRSGRPAYTRRELQERVGRGIGERFPRWKRVAEAALVEVWVLQEGDEILCGVRLSDRTMRHRSYKRASIPASLRPAVARSMVILAEPRDDDVFLDPMCGAGTILIERGEHGRYRQLLGGDIDSEAAAAARTNIGPKYKPIEIREWDATDLPLPDGAVTRIVCNLPFGRKIGSRWENQELYRGFVEEAVRVLQPGGVMVLLTSDRRLLAGTLKDRGELELERIYPIFVLGQKAFIFKTRLTQ